MSRGIDFEGLPLALCITSRGRTWQLKQTLANNVLVAMRFMPGVTYYLLDMNEDADTELEDYIKTGPLEFAWRLEVLRYYRCAMPWHASVAKNTVHMLPWTVPHPDRKRTIVASLDGDNLVTSRFLEDLRNRARDLLPSDELAALACPCLPSVQPFVTQTRPKSKATAARGSAAAPVQPLPSSGWPRTMAVQHKNPKDGSTTGRITLSLVTFSLLGGYDQDFQPSGYQDVDLMRMAAKLGEAKRVESEEIAWTCVPNYPGGKKKKGHYEASCTAKLANVAEEHQGKTWATMNQENMKLGSAKLARGEVRRNVSKAILGAEFVSSVECPSEWKLSLEELLRLWKPAAARQAAEGATGLSVVPPGSPPRPPKQPAEPAGEAAASGQPASSKPAAEGATGLSVAPSEPAEERMPSGPSSSTPQLVELYVFTFGVAELCKTPSFQRLDEAWKLRGATNRPGPPAAIDLNALAALLVKGGQTVPDVLFDCRPFVMHHSQRAAQHGHIGSHPAQVQFIANHNMFPDLLARVAQAWFRALLGSRKLALGFFCKRGEQRSVGACTIVSWLLQRTGAVLTSDSPAHLCRAYWGRYSCAGQDGRPCAECSTPISPSEQPGINLRLLWIRAVEDAGAGS